MDALGGAADFLMTQNSTSELSSCLGSKIELAICHFQIETLLNDFGHFLERHLAMSSLCQPAPVRHAGSRLGDDIEGQRTGRCQSAQSPL